MAFQVPSIIRLGQVPCTTSIATLYTVPSSSRTFIETLDVVNTGSASATFDIYLVPSAGSATTSNALFYQQTLLAKQNIQWTGIQVIDTGYKIQVKASTTGINVTISGETYEYI